MLPEEKQFAKTFDVSKDSFVILKDRNVDLDSLEELRFVVSQINLFYSKFERIMRLMAHDRAEQLSKEGLRRVDELVKRFEVLNARVDLVAVSVENVEKRFGSVRESLVGLVDSRVEGKELVSKLSSVEMSYGELSAYKLKDIFLNLVEVVGSIGKRVGELEHVVKELGLSVSKDFSKNNETDSSVASLKKKFSAKSLKKGDSV